MASKKVFKVSFKGIILTGFNKDQVIDNVHEITRIPKQTITRKFFSGKTVVIRHADTQDYASRLQKTFAQAGIETYINEFTETVSEDLIDTDSIAQDNTNTPAPSYESNSVEAPSEIQKSHISKITVATAVIVVISLIIVFFVTVNNQPDVDTVQQQSDSSSVDNLENKEAILAIDNSPDFFTKGEIRGLIKITNNSELKQLIQFSTLLSIKTNLIEVIIEKVSKKLNSSLNISKKNPLYLFKTMNKTEPQFSILLSMDKSLPTSLITQLNKELNNPELQQNEFISSCAPKSTVKVLNVNNYLLVTTIDDKKLADFEFSLKQKKLSNNLLKLDSLFIQTNDNAKTNFSLYYQNSDNVSTLSLSSNNELFWLSLDKNSKEKMQQLFQQLKINTEKSNKRSAIKTNNLYNQTLIIIAEQNEVFKSSHSLTGTSPKKAFQPEQIVKIVKSYSSKELQDYKNKLDIELLAQWQAGPFAITTNQFQFNKNLSIELLAKGQNVKNLMEYSQSAFLTIDSVFNNTNVNILTPDCSSDKAYFKDIDGEQEAYINDDFISYQTITAKHTVNIEPGYNNSDIDKIEGEIILKLPQKIQQKIINFQNTNLYTQIEDFSLLTKYFKKSNTLEFKIIGHTDQFINIRAYNYSGNVIETLSLEQNAFFKNKLKTYRQTFAEPIEVIKAFYSKDSKIIKYPFAFKPEILPGQVLTDVQEENEISSIDSQLIPYESGKLDFLPLNKEIQDDNPQWLGTKWVSDEITPKKTSPFYINLFMHASDGTHVDSVLNIKSSLSAFITQNITAVKLTLIDDKITLIDNFISFNMNELIEGEPEVGKDGQVIPPKMTLYLNSSSAFEINNQLASKSKNAQLHGHLTLSLPNAFKTHSKKYTTLGQTIKLDGLFIQTVKLNKHQIQFELRGNIKALVQLKLYNKKNKLISEPFEFSHIDNKKALITLLYHDEIDSVKLVLSQNSTIEEYPFSFSK